MRTVSATEAARRFSDLLDAVEHGREAFVVIRRGRAVARIEPAATANGKAVKEYLLAHRPDAAWADELRDLRDRLFLEERAWSD